MLGRAKWLVPVSVVPSKSRAIFIHMCRDAWAKHNDLEAYEAKWLYVEALLKVCTSSDELSDVVVVTNCAAGPSEVFRQNCSQRSSSGAGDIWK
jgi:hypothetical protein